MNSESMANLQIAYQEALNGKPSQYPLIEMVIFIEKYYFEYFLLGYSFFT
jgi:hypothetical protein